MLHREPSMAVSNAGAASVSGDPRRNVAFVAFKREEGLQLAEQVASTQSELTNAKAKIRELSAQVNAAKRGIDTLNAQVQEKRSGVGGDAIDAEEYDIVGQLKAAKQAYRGKFDELKDVKAALELIVVRVGDSRASLMEAFNEWYDSGAAEDLVDGADLDPDEEFARQQQEGWKASDPEAAAYLSAKRGTKAMARPAGKYGGDKGRAQNIRRMEALR